MTLLKGARGKIGAMHDCADFFVMQAPKALFQNDRITLNALHASQYSFMLHKYIHKKSFGSRVFTGFTPRAPLRVLHGGTLTAFFFTRPLCCNIEKGKGWKHRVQSPHNGISLGSFRDAHVFSVSSSTFYLYLDIQV